MSTKVPLQRRRAAMALVALVAVLLPAAHHAVFAGESAADFSLPNVQGGSFSYSLKNHRNLLIAFLQTQPDSDAQNVSRSCVPSLMSMDHQYRSKDLDVVIVDATALGLNKVQARRAGKAPSRDALVNTSYDWSLSIPLLEDPGGKVARLYRVNRVPTLILVDASGRITQRWEDVPHPSTLAGGIQQLVGGPMTNRSPAASQIE